MDYYNGFKLILHDQLLSRVYTWRHDIRITAGCCFRFLSNRHKKTFRCARNPVPAIWIPRSTWCLWWPRITRAHATLSDVERGRSVVATSEPMSVWRLSACILHMRRSYAGGLLAQPASSKCFRLISNTWCTNPTDYCDCRIYWRDGRPDIIANHAVEGSGPLSRPGISDAGYFDLDTPRFKKTGRFWLFVNIRASFWDVLAHVYIVYMLKFHATHSFCILLRVPPRNLIKGTPPINCCNYCWSRCCPFISVRLRVRWYFEN